MVIKSFFKLTLIVYAVVIGVGYTGFTKADQNEIRVKYCKNPQCTEVSDILTIDEFAKLKQLQPIKEESNFYDMLGLYLTAAIPIIGLLWWIINIQQDKKNLEQNIKQESTLDNKLEKILNKQELIITDFGDEIEKLHFKFEQILQQLTAYQLEAVKTVYSQNGKIELLIENLATTKALIAKVEDIENFLATNYQYNVRHQKAD
jgi:hypothetical protein